MGSELRNKKLSLEKKLQANAKLFSFEMAANILEYNAPTSFGKEASILYAPFRTQSINSFHLRATEIEKIEEVSNEKIIYIERLSLMGLNAPMPMPYSELIFRRTMEKDIAMASFINTFNMRLLGISYQISKRRYVNLQDHRKGNCMLIRVLAAFYGENPATMDRSLSRISYLFWTKEKSAAGLESIISSIFKLKTRVEQFQTLWTDVKNTGLFGISNLKLGKGALLGKKTSISSFGVKIHITSDDFSKILALLTCKEYLLDVKFIVKKYLGEFFDCVFEVEPKKVPILKIGHTFLGKTSWIPYKSIENNKSYQSANIL